ncbi:MAG: ribosomal L7Ae/L30e/S12e/Gadd45 family protein [Oscillospiraceae bacterium]|jgi:ribosomal protein L30E|nr:ribosomal L7Ae/L30e/S12e/Gadd45 family protein [Oscillospiraceae bacterium]
MNNTLNTLGLCKKAGKLIAGFDTVAANGGKISGVIIARDLSEKSKKEIAYHCGKHGKPLHEINETMSQIGGVLGKRTGIIAILDDGLYNALIKSTGDP